jgi:hypothetical protein
MFNGLMKLFFKNFPWRQFRQILGYPNTAFFEFQQFHSFVLFASA